MTDDDWTHAVERADRSEARRLLAQIEADERYGINIVFEILDSFQVRSVMSIPEDELPVFINLCRRKLQDPGL